MPSKKIISVSIICLAIIFSVWLLNRSKINSSIISIKTNNLGVVNQNKTLSNKNWLDTLSKIGYGTTTQSSIQGISNYPGEGTYTDQIAKNFMGQYLSTINTNGGNLTDEEISQIAQNAISSPEFTKATGVQYSYKDLNVINDTSKNATKQYVLEGWQIIQNNTSSDMGDEMTILKNAIESGKESDMAKMDPIIKNYKEMIAELLKMQVPKDATNIHLEFLNSLSNLLANVEAMRQALNDPVRAFAGLSQYEKHLDELGVSSQNIANYYNAKFK